MPTYISLINWTDQGIRSAKDTLDRASAAAAAAESMGGKLKDIYWTVGPYDIVTVAQFPDDATGTAFLLALGSQGNVRTTTLRAFSRDEVAEILQKTP
jgi:uncharacterized protein with GYD domain